jgi:hypothetical protein
MRGLHGYRLIVTDIGVICGFQAYCGALAGEIGSETDAVFAGGFRLIHGGIRTGDQLLGG